MFSGERKMTKHIIGTEPILSAIINDGASTGVRCGQASGNHLRLRCLENYAFNYSHWPSEFLKLLRTFFIWGALWASQTSANGKGNWKCQKRSANISKIETQWVKHGASLSPTIKQRSIDPYLSNHQFTINWPLTNDCKMRNKPGAFSSAPMGLEGPAAHPPKTHVVPEIKMHMQIAIISNH